MEVPNWALPLIGSGVTLSVEYLRKYLKQRRVGGEDFTSSYSHKVISIVSRGKIINYFLGQPPKIEERKPKSKAKSYRVMCSACGRMFSSHGFLNHVRKCKVMTAKQKERIRKRWYSSS